MQVIISMMKTFIKPTDSIGNSLRFDDELGKRLEGTKWFNDITRMIFVCAQGC